MASQPAFASSPRHAQVAFSTANTNRDGTTGTYATGFTGGANGSRVERIRLHATGTTTAGVVRIWIHDGTNRYLWKEVLVQAITPGTATAAWSADISLAGANGILLPNNSHHIDFTTHNAEGFVAFIEGGDF